MLGHIYALMPHGLREVSTNTNTLSVILSIDGMRNSPLNISYTYSNTIGKSIILGNLLYKARK